MLEDDQFRINWHRRKGRGLQFVAMVMEEENYMRGETPSNWWMWGSTPGVGAAQA